MGCWIRTLWWSRDPRPGVRWRPVGTHGPLVANDRHGREDGSISICSYALCYEYMHNIPLSYHLCCLLRLTTFTLQEMWDKNISGYHFEPTGIIPKQARSRVITSELRTSESEMRTHQNTYTYPPRLLPIARPIGSETHQVRAGDTSSDPYPSSIWDVMLFHGAQEIMWGYPGIFSSTQTYFHFPLLPADNYSSIHHSLTYATSSIHAYHSSIRLFQLSAIYAHFIPTWLIPPLVTL